MQNALRYLIAYLAWAVVATVGFWLLFQIRINLLDILTLLLEDPNTFRDSWITRAIDRWFIMVMGAMWVFCVTLLEGYFRNSVAKQLMVHRIGRVFLILGLLTGISLLLQQVL